MSSTASFDVFTCPLDGVSLIEAGAGTGKTWNLCGLVLRLLLERELEIQQILVVTFTKAATAELRERVRGRLVDTLDGLDGDPRMVADPFVAGLLQHERAAGLDDASMRERLTRALQTFDEAAIFTIHAFCQRALGDAPFAAGTPMQLELMSDDSALRLQVTQDFWRRHVAADDTPEHLPPAVAEARAAHLIACQDSPVRWAELLKRRTAKPLARLIWPDALDDAAEPARSRAAIAQALSVLPALLQQAATLWRAERAAVLQGILDGIGSLSATKYKPHLLEKIARGWDALLATTRGMPARDAELRYERFGEADLLASRKKGKNLGPEVAAHAFHALADRVLEQLDALDQGLALERSRLLRRLLEEGPATLRALKQERRVVAFDDLLENLHHRLHDGPRGEALARALRERYPAALIDEFQDTDPLQFGNFRRLYVGAPGRRDAPPGLTLFLVGDPKQAIYAFRNADLHTYLAARGEADHLHALNANQRSVVPLIDGLNRLWTHNPKAFGLDDLHYLPVTVGDKPRPSLVDDSGIDAAALQLWQLPTDGEGAPLRRAQAMARVRQACAVEIARLLAAGRDGSLRLDGRAVRAGDIAVLVQSHAHGAAMRQALALQGVGCVELSQASVFASAEARALEHLLAAVLQPSRESLVRRALATELMGWQARDIDRLADDESRWLAVLAAMLDDRETWLREGAGVMLRRWMQRERVAERLLARPDGERRLTNLLHLAEMLQAAAQEQPTPQALLRWLQASQRDDGMNEAAQLRLESDRNLVQIVTVHRSKGLEYPFVFCPTLWSGLGPQRGGEGREYHDDDGRPVIDLRPADGPWKAEVDERIRLERAAEAVRLLYVALTRAVHRCTVVVGVDLAGGKNGSVKTSARSALNWLAAGAGHTLAAWHASKGEPAALSQAGVDAAWREIAGGVADAADALPLPLRLEPLPDRPAPPIAAGADLDQPIVAATPPQPLPGGWRLGSYSSLVAGLGHERAAADHDQHAGALAGQGVVEDDGEVEAEGDRAVDDEVVDDEVPTGAAGPAQAGSTTTASPPGQQSLPFDEPEPPAHVAPAHDAAPAATVLDEDDLLNFPRGATAGVCLHAAFEAADFDDPASWPAAVALALRRHPPLSPSTAGLATPGGPDDALLARMLTRGLHDVLATPLPIGPSPLALSALPRRRRLAEMEFNLPAAALDTQALLRCMQHHGLPTPALPPGRLQGYLRGFIDLVFEHEGRFHIVDWKSNHLGLRPLDYAGAALAAAMEAHGYRLQALLYAVALHRHLRHRLPDYDPARHLGEVLYLFVRGVRPGWRDAAGHPCGVFSWQPTPALIEEASALLEAPARPARVAMARSTR